MATVKGTTQNKRKRQPAYKATRKRSRECKELSSALLSLQWRSATTSVTEEMNALLANHTKKDFQEAVLLKDNDGSLPIHTACDWHLPVEVIRLLLDSDDDKKTIFEKDGRGLLPIHWACLNEASVAWWDHKAPVEVIQLLLDNDGDKKSILEKDGRGHLPIHLACYGRAPVEVIQLLLDNDTEKQTIHVKDNCGQFPIHLACFGGAPVEVIQLLLDSDTGKKMIFEKSNYGKLPIHCGGGRASVEVIQLLLDSDTEKKTILEKDNDGELPIHSACKWGAPVEVIQLLLQASICDRIDQLGLAQWKIGVKKLINDMTADDSKTKKVQHIYKRLSNCEELEHTMSLLALIIWRTSCLHWGDIQFQSMQQMEDLRATNDAFDPSQYKRERRIKSGADVIIRGVLPFLPVDDETPTPQSSASDGDGSL